MTSGRAPSTAQRVTAGDSEADSDGPGPHSARSPSRVCTWNVGGSVSPDARKRPVLPGASSSGLWLMLRPVLAGHIDAMAPGWARGGRGFQFKHCCGLSKKQDGGWLRGEEERPSHASPPFRLAAPALALEPRQPSL